MGLFKIVCLIVVPAGALIVSTFRLGKDLPRAARLMGNYIGLSYVYFKVILKALRPAHDMGAEIIDVVRKTSQQVMQFPIEDKSLKEIAEQYDQEDARRR